MLPSGCNILSRLFSPAVSRYSHSGAVAWRAVHRHKVMPTPARPESSTELCLQFNTQAHTLRYRVGSVTLPFVITDVTVPVQFAAMLYKPQDSVEVLDLMQSSGEDLVPDSAEVRLPFSF